MRKRTISVFLMLIVASTGLEAKAQTMWTKKYLALQSANMASAAFDSWTTVHNLNNGCRENNPLLGSRPSTAHIALFEAGWTGGEALVAWMLRKHHHNDLAAIFLGESVVEHGVAGGFNTRQRCF